MSVLKIERENVVLSPIRLSPEPKVNQSRSGQALAYDLLLEPPSLQEKVVAITPAKLTDMKDPMEKLISAEKRKEDLESLSLERIKLRREKLESAKSHVLASIENHQQQVKARAQKKEETAEELKVRKERELEIKRIARELKALEARKCVLEKEKERDRENNEQKKLSMSKIKHAEELREANVQAVVEKAKKVITKCNTTLALQQKKKDELDCKIRQDLMHKTEIRENRISTIKEKCANHVKDAKIRANNVKCVKCEAENSPPKITQE